MKSKFGERFNFITVEYINSDCNKTINNTQLSDEEIIIDDLQSERVGQHWNKTEDKIVSLSQSLRKQERKE